MNNTKCCDNTDCEYSVVRVDVCSGVIFLQDMKDKNCLAIDPEEWEGIKDNIDQQIAEGCLDGEY